MVAETEAKAGEGPSSSLSSRGKRWPRGVAKPRACTLSGHSLAPAYCSRLQTWSHPCAEGVHVAQSVTVVRTMYVDAKRKAVDVIAERKPQDSLPWRYVRAHTGQVGVIRTTFAVRLIRGPGCGIEGSHLPTRPLLSCDSTYAGRRAQARRGTLNPHIMR